MVFFRRLILKKKILVLLAMSMTVCADDEIGILMKKEATGPVREPKENPNEVCSFLTVRHIDAGSVGYVHGYTSLTGLVFPVPQEQGAWVRPFIDLRFHEFNDNHQAANAGAGVRFAPYSIEKVIGLNVYYDYRNSHDHYNQAGMGFEFLGKRMDLRINGYLPFGEKKHRIDHCSHRFPGDFFISRRKYEIALRGGDLEVGGLIIRTRPVDIYSAIGPYYYGGDVCRHVFGGRFRLNFKFRKYGFVEGIVTHDNVFETKVQGMVGLTFPLGCKRIENRSRSHRTFPEEIMTQPVQRDEIIVLDKNCRWRANF